MYCTTSAINTLARSEHMQKVCLEYIATPGTVPSPALRFSSVFSLYCALEHGVRFGDYCERTSICQLGIDPARFILFGETSPSISHNLNKLFLLEGIVNKFLRRLHEYPARLKSEAAALADALGPPLHASAHAAARLVALLDGAHCTDAIGCALGLGHAHLTALLHAVAATVVIVK